MAAFKDVTEIVAWQLAHQLNLRVEVFLACPEFRRHFKSCERLSHAARQAPRHIAEGHGRLKHREFAGFVRAARGLEKEVLKHLFAAREQLLITDDELIINKQLAKRAIRAAGSLIRYLDATSDLTRQERGAKSHGRADQPPEIRVQPAGSVRSELHGKQRHHPDDDRSQGVSRAGTLDV